MPSMAEDDDNATKQRDLAVRAHSRPNLFARLPRDVALEFASDIASQHQRSVATDEDEIQFLVLEITTDNGTCVYVSYNGGDLLEEPEDWNTESSCLPCIELPTSIIHASHLPSVVSVRPVPNVPVASSLTLQAVSDLDYMRLSQFSDWLEQGGLLKQVSVVYANQVLALDVGGQAVQVQVLSDEDGYAGGAKSSRDAQTGSSSADQSYRCIWDDEPAFNVSHGPLRGQDERDDRNDSTPRAWRIMAATELTVLPPEPPTPPTKISCRLYPTQLDYPFLKSLPESVSQGCALIHPKLLQDLCDAASADTLGSPLYVRMTVTTANEATATSEQPLSVTNRFLRLELSELVPQGWIGLHPLTRMELELQLAKDTVLLELEPRNDVRNLCATARFVGARLERTQLKLTSEQPPWRYPSIWNASARANRTSDIDTAAMLEGFGDDETPIKMDSLVMLPWRAARSQPCENLLYRAQVSPEGRERLKSLPMEDLYVFSADIRKPAVYSREKVASSVAADSMDVLQAKERFSLAKSLQGRSFYCAMLYDAVPARVGSVLLCGGTGSGKTTAALLIAARMSLQRHAVYVDCRRLRETRGMRLSTILQELEGTLIEATLCDSSLVILDNLDEVLQDYGSDAPETGSVHVVQPNPSLKDECIAIEAIICTSMAKSSKNVQWVVTCSEAASLPASFRSRASFDTAVNLPLLAGHERLELFLDWLCVDDTSVRNEFARSLPDFAGTTFDFRPSDLERLASRVKQHSGALPLSLAETTRKLLDKYIPLSKLSVSSEQSHLDYEWPDVGGLFDVKDELLSVIEKPSLYKRIYDRAQIRLPRGMLLFGPSGVGKSHIVPALANKCGFPLIVCRGPELLSKYIGASESKVRELFARAAAVAPSILFLDDFEALAPRRGTDSTGVTDRVVNQLLTFLDGVEDSNSLTGTVYIIAASSRPDKIDPALLRPGRLERHVYVGTPRTIKEWTDLILQTARRYGVSDVVLERISSGLLLQDLRVAARHAFQFTAADVNAVFHAAQVKAAHETVALGRGGDCCDLRHEHILDAFRSTRPSLSMDGWKRLESVYEKFRVHRPGSSRSEMHPVEQESLRVALL